MDFFPCHNTWWHHDLVPTAPFLTGPGSSGLGITLYRCICYRHETQKVAVFRSFSLEHPSILFKRAFSIKLLFYIWPVTAAILQTDL